MSAGSTDGFSEAFDPKGGRLMVTIARPVRGNRTTVLGAAARSESRAPRVTLQSAGIVLAAVATLLTAFTMYVPQASADVWAINRVQEIDAPYLHDAVTIVSTLTSTEGAVALWTITMLAFMFRRLWLPALATLSLPLGCLINNFIG
ncbi:MAG: hypothetical protein WD628_01555, partial [Thermomicrobiales bacterium]